MDKQQARQIIKETFENPFDKGRFTGFVKNLLNRIDEGSFTYQGTYIPEKFRPYIKTLERIGKFSDGEKSLDILIITLQKETSLERARTMQRNFIAWYLNGSRGGQMKDAALVAYVSPEQADWRFSLVKMDYKFEKGKTGKVKVREEFTPARRWSFLVGVNEKSHTAQSRLVNILANDEQTPTLAELEEAFNIETVTKEFFLKYRELFLRTKEALDRVVKNDPKAKADFEAKGVDTVNFAKKLLGQIVFLYFLQKKGWFGVGRDDDWGTGSKHFLRSLFDKKHSGYNNFFNEILEPLFYEALRIDRSHDDDYYSRFNCKIPFLNGGLFDPIGNYDWVHTDINLPNDLFSNSRKTKEGDTGDGILDVFDRYNFTVREDEPLEKEVAVDPELLGKAYEKFNAIRLDNFAEFTQALKSGNKGEENKFNKKFGVYYTPREIVHYMCKQSLINYLYTKVTQAFLPEAITRQDIEDLIEVGELITEHEATALIKQEKIKSGIQKSTEYTALLSESIRENAAAIDKWLEDITVCDPAVGSGAFPVGMMNEIVRARNVLSVFLNDWKRNDYEFKHRCIEHSLYGVDIDPGAVEIAKLRLWLSLVVDEEDIKNIKPLPNLDYKIVCGNSLLGVEKDLFNQKLFTDLEKLKPLYFNETNPTKKQTFKKQIDDLISQITNGHTEFDFDVYFSEVFHNKGGFDVVIANPPYVQLQKDGGNLANLYKNRGYKTFERTGDIYVLFYEKGLNILKNTGHLCFITSNKWMRAGYGKSLRKFFNSYNPLLLIDLGPGIFESATVDTNILMVEKGDNQGQLSGITLTPDAKDIGLTAFIKKNKNRLPKMGEDAWHIGNQAEQDLKEKIERIGKPLKEWDVKIYYGIKTGLNEAFIITTEKRNEILSNCKDEEERKHTEAIIKPILRGRDIKRYSYEWAGLWVIGTFPALHLNIEDYPALKKYFLDNFDIRQLEQSGKKYAQLGFNARKKTGNKWFETQDQIAYYPEFEKEKVVWKALSLEPAFSLVPSGLFNNDKANLLTSSKSDTKYLCALMNSKLSQFYFSSIGVSMGAGYEYKIQFIEKIPFPPVTSSNKGIVERIERIVEKILSAKKQNPKADTREYEKQIDQMVYELYGLTEEEIKIVEGETQ
jgi:hypothetical protein